MFAENPKLGFWIFLTFPASLKFFNILEQTKNKTKQTIIKEEIKTDLTKKNSSNYLISAIFYVQLNFFLSLSAPILVGQ